jgi:hypothetical protein
MNTMTLPDLLKTCLLCVVAIPLIALSTKAQSNVIKTFGVPPADPSNIKLVLHADRTFTYQDFSHPTQKIKVSGTYTTHGAHLKLKASSEEQYAFHDRWKMVKQETSIKSRKGLTFYRLARLD